MKTKWLVATVTLALSVALVQPSLAAGDPLNNDFLIQTEPATANLFANEVSVSAKAAAAIDVQTGRLLYEKNATQQMLIASTTKIITAIVAIESGKNLDSVVTVSRNAAGKEGSSIYLKVGEKQTLRDLLYAVMLRSGNDAATAVAEYCGDGSEKKFVDMMNAKVQELGLTGTHFANPHGLDAKGHYSTAHDMAILTAYALRNPTFAEIVKTQVKTIPQPDEAWDRKMYNKNKMLARYDGADGVKTGYTKAAGRCLVSSASKDGRQVAVVTLDAPSDWMDHTNLLNYGFSKYGSTPVIKGNAVIQTVPVEDGIAKQVDVVAGQDFNYPIRSEERDKLRTEVQLDDELDAPVVAGEKVGEARIYFDDKLVGVVSLLAGHDVEEKSFLQKMKSIFFSMITR
ncbi:MAG: D-alanyl-D-alanine carboxypeptidase family protein [Tumebacillaceae bacterium]